VNIRGMEVGPEAKAQIDAAAAAATAVDADAPQKVAASKTELHTGEVSGDGAIGGMTGGEVNQTFIDSIRIERNEAADHIRGLFGPASDQESPEVAVEDVLPVPGTEAHFKSLDETRLLILASTRRTGLTTAARQRCRAYADRESLPAKRLLSTSLDELGKELRGIGTATVLVLDASQNPELQQALLKCADQLRDRLKNQSCHLVLAVEIEFRRSFKDQFPGTVFDLERLQPDLVFAHYLKRPEDQVASILASEYFRDTLGPAWPPLARLMAEVLNEAPDGIAPEQFRERLGARLGNPSESIRNLLERSLDKRGRAVLIAAAALEQMTPEAIALAADELLEATRPPDDRRERLDEPGIAQKLELIREDFNLVGSTFKNPDIGDEVLLHVWRQYPSWREPVMNWLDGLLLAPDYVEWTDRTRLPRRLVLLASAAEDDRMLKNRVKLMLQSRSPVMSSFAPAIMLGGAIDPVIGPGIRNRLYEWSRSAQAALQRTALATCSDEDYLVRFPSEALFRLHLLSESKFGDVADAAFEAIIDSTGHFHLTELLLHFRYWLIGSSGDEPARIAKILDRICDRPDLVDRLEQDPMHLLRNFLSIPAGFWKSMSQLADAASFRLAVRAWLILAAKLDAQHAEGMVDLLIAAGADDHRAIGQIVQAARSLSLEGTDLSDRARKLALFMYNRVFEIEVPLQ